MYFFRATKPSTILSISSMGEIVFRTGEHDLGVARHLERPGDAVVVDERQPADLGGIVGGVVVDRVRAAFGPQPPVLGG